MIKLTKIFFFKNKSLPAGRQGLLVRRSLGEGGRIKDNKGFTLIEILVVMAIFILIAGFALFVSMDSYRGFSFRSERDTIISVLQKARSQAISNVCLGTCTGINNDGKKHGVRFDTADKQYIIFQTTTDYANGHDAGVDQAVPMNNVLGFNPSLPLPPPPFDIIFNQLDGTSVGGTFTVSDSSHPPSQISVNSEGQIDNP